MNTSPSKHLITFAAARVMAGYTPKQAATILGITEAQLLKHEADPGRVRSSLLLRMAQLYKVSVDNVCTEVIESYVGKDVIIAKMAY